METHNTRTCKLRDYRHETRELCCFTKGNKSEVTCDKFNMNKLLRNESIHTHRGIKQAVSCS